MAKKTESNEQPKVGRPPKELTITDIVVDLKKAMANIQQLAREGKFPKVRAQNRVRDLQRIVGKIETMRV